VKKGRQKIDLEKNFKGVENAELYAELKLLKKRTKKVNPHKVQINLNLLVSESRKVWFQQSILLITLMHAIFAILSLDLKSAFNSTLFESLY